MTLRRFNCEAHHVSSMLLGSVRTVRVAVTPCSVANQLSRTNAAADGWWHAELTVNA